MGNWARAIQVHAPEKVTDSASVMKGIRHWTSTNNIHEVTEGTEAFNCELIIGSTNKAYNWCPIYLSHLGWEGHLDNRQLLLELGKAISSNTNDYAISISLEDSDALTLWLCHSGELVDHYESDPTYHYEEAENSNGWSGQPEKWQTLLRKETSVETFSVILAEEMLFAEKTLAKIAESLNFAYDDYLLLDPPYGELPASFTRLRFFIPVPKPTASTVPFLFRNDTIKQTPYLELQEKDDHLSLHLGEHLPARIFLRCSYFGEPTLGLTLTLTGSALTQKLVHLEQIIILFGKDEQKSIFINDDEQDTKQSFQFVLNDLPLKEVFLVADGTFPEKFRGQKIPLISVSIRLIGQARQLGYGQLTAQLTPHASSVSGAASSSINVFVYPRPHIPLRSAYPADRDSLSVMAQPIQLIGFLVMGDEQANTARPLERAIKKWHNIIGLAGTQQYTIWYGLSREHKFKHIKVKASQFLHDESWLLWRNNLKNGFALNGRIPTVNPKLLGEDVEGLSSGFSFGISDAGFPHPDNPFIPYVCFWLDWQAFPSNRQDDLIQRLTAILEDLLRETNGLQAFIARWNWQPEVGDPLIPYELACHVGSFGSLNYDWCIRYLKGVSERMWLSQPLWQRIPQPENLQEIAHIEAVGSAYRLVLRDSSNESLDVLEKILEPLLAGRSEWEQEMNRQRDRYQKLVENKQ